MQRTSTENVSNLSNRRLWEILRQHDQPGVRVIPVAAAQVRAELAARNENCESRRWHAPR